MQHRRLCQASCPTGGWPPPPAAAARLLCGLGERRADLLRTRGLLVLSIPRPALQREDVAIRWLSEPPDAERSDLRWYTDGSLRYGPQWELRRTGVAVVVVSAGGDLLAFGHAVPPPWVRSAAAAELWALLLVARAAGQLPTVVTDCRALLTTATAGTARATDPRRLYAHVWRQITVALGVDVADLAASGRLCWMPAHGAAHTVGVARRSDGGVVTALDWRANRLADALAKAAADGGGHAKAAQAAVGTAEALVRHEAAVLGAVTFAANHHWAEAVDGSGRYQARLLRDSTGAKRPRALAGARAEAAAVVPAGGGGCSTPQLGLPGPPSGLGPVPAPRGAAARRAASAMRAAAAADADRVLLQSRVAALRPASLPPARGRLEALRARVLARAALAGPGGC